VKNDFIKPLYGLITICQENPLDVTLLKQVAQKADNVASDALLEKIARLFEDNEDHMASLEYYEKARGINPDINYTVGIIQNLIALKNYSRAERELSSALNYSLGRPFRENLDFLSSVIEFEKGSYKKSRETIGKILSQKATNPLYLVHKARISAQADDYSDALGLLSQAISLKKELPVAYFEQAKIYYSQKKIARAQEALEKTLYYNNQNSLAYTMLQMLRAKKWMPLASLAPNRTIQAFFDKGSDHIALVKGDTITLSVAFSEVSKMRQFNIGFLEPYGFGLKAERVDAGEHTFEGEEQNLRAVFRLKALRSSKTNLDHPWLLNIVLVDMESGKYVSKQLSVTVKRDEKEEGRILFVLTEDHERLGDFPSSDDTPDIPDVDPYEINTDLIQKSLFADKIADEHGIKWSHIIDIGSSFLRLKWIQDQHHGNQWDTVWDNMNAYLKQATAGGHDVQLHIHGYAIPGNKLFRQYFDNDTDRIRFKDNIVRPEIVHDIHGAWSENFIQLGEYDKPDSRVGSIFQGIKILEGELRGANPSYRNLFFRAGEYEFGRGESSVRKSIIALKKNKILCDSDAIYGSPFRRGFKFFNRVGNNVYFSKPDNILERAVSLLDIGLLEIVPVAQINDRNYVRPVDSGEHIKFNYDFCMSGGKIRNEIFIIMEMYHLGNTNWAHQWDKFDVDYEDWGRMNNHFSYIKNNCPKMEYVTISEAIKAYLDCYSPDIIAMRTDEKKVNEKLYLYIVNFYGKDIEVSSSRPHYVSIKPPSYFLNKSYKIKIELFHNDVLVKSWNSINDYEDLEFIAISKRGYTARVHLQ
jgi:tetratricopeptide (TPR) repeat protein